MASGNDPATSETLTQILQYALGVGTAIGTALATFFGVRARMRRNGNGNGEAARNGDAPRPIGRGVEWFWDGPVGKALETLQGIYRVLTETRADRQRHADEARADEQRFADERNRKMDEQTALLREIEVNTRDSRAGRPRRE